MISGDLNQLLKKIKRHRSLCFRTISLFLSVSPPPLPRSLISFRIYPCLFLLALVSSMSFLFIFFLFAVLHDNESLPCSRKGIICGTGSKMPREPHYRMHDYHDSGAAFVSTSFPFGSSLFASPLPLTLSLFLFPRSSLATQSPATRSTEADPTSSPRRSRRYRGVGTGGAVNQRQGRVVGRGIGAARCFWNDVVQRLQTLIAERSGFTGAMQIEPRP